MDRGVHKDGPPSEPSTNPAPRVADCLEAFTTKAWKDWVEAAGNDPEKVEAVLGHASVSTRLHLHQLVGGSIQCAGLARPQS